MKLSWQIPLGVLVLAALLGSALYWQHVFSSNLPPVTACHDRADAHAQALDYQAAHGGRILTILGTGSMAPYIPAAAPGLDTEKTIVAYVVTEAHATFDDITPGSLVTYRAAWSEKYSIIHVAALKDSGGWIMSGLHNPRSEPQWRVTADNFLGLAAHTFTWPQ